MRKTFTLLALLPIAAIAQTTWDVEVGGSLLPGFSAPYYDPMDLIIEAGDIVHWHAIEGTHNVYGALDMFPDNPEGFDSGSPASAPWDFSHTFNIPGLYEYHCTQQNHATTQHGTITVLDPNHVTEVSPWGSVVIFPMPANEQVTVVLSQPTTVTAEIICIDGRTLSTQQFNGAGSVSLDMNPWPAGRYILRLRDENGRLFVRPFIKQ